MSHPSNRSRLVRVFATAWVGGLVLPLAVAGCSRNRPGGQVADGNGRTWTTRAEANKNVQRDEFERSGDAPVNADTFFAAGQLAETQDFAPKAEEAYKKALTLDPKHP